MCKMTWISFCYPKHMAMTLTLQNVFKLSPPTCKLIYEDKVY